MSSRVDHGTVFVEIGGTEYELKLTPDAFRKIQRRFGGYRQALQSLMDMNSENLAHIIAAGADIDRKQIQALEDDIIMQGIFDVTERVSPYVQGLGNPTGKDAGEGK